MLVIGSLFTLAIFLFVGWAVSTEMFQHRAWRQRVSSGDTAIVAALIEEALGGWRRQRPPRGTPANLWAGIQGLQLLAVTEDSATASSSAEAEFRSEDGRRVQVHSALDEAISLAAKAIDMMLYDVPNLQLAAARVDVFTTFTGSAQSPVQEPILSVSANRADADAIDWEALTPEEVLGRFSATYKRTDSGEGAPIVLAPIEGTLPEQPVTATGASDEQLQERD